MRARARDGEHLARVGPHDDGLAIALQDREQTAGRVELGQRARPDGALHQSVSSVVAAASSEPATTCSASERRWWPSTSSSNE